MAMARSDPQPPITKSRPSVFTKGPDVLPWDSSDGWGIEPEEAPTEIMTIPDPPDLQVPNTYMFKHDLPDAEPTEAPVTSEGIGSTPIRIHWSWIALPLIVAVLLASQWR